MRRRKVIPLLLILAVQAAGQTTPDCGPVIVQKLDSVVGYAREGLTDSYTPVDLFIYQYDEAGRYPVVDRISLPLRTPVNRQNYFFDETGRKTWYILQNWNGSGFFDHARTDYYYTDAGYLEGEIFSGFEDALWVPYQYHIYNYDENNNIRTYLRKMMYVSGVWTDFSYKNYIYDGSGRLIERNEQRIADGVIFWVELFTYNDRNKVATRVRQSLKYDPVSRTYALVNLNRQIYSYDVYGELSRYYVETWDNGNWRLTGKSVYYRTLFSRKLVPVCYKGKTHIMPVSSVARVLARGGLLGACECLFPTGENHEIKPPDLQRNHRGSAAEVTVYPNPASSRITVSFPESAGKFTELTLYNSHGSLIRQQKITDQPVTLDISSLSPGSYFIMVSGDDEPFYYTFIKSSN